MFNSNTEVVKVLSNKMADAEGDIGLSLLKKKTRKKMHQMMNFMIVGVALLFIIIQQRRRL